MIDANEGGQRSREKGAWGKEIYKVAWERTGNKFGIRRKLAGKEVKKIRWEYEL